MTEKNSTLTGKIVRTLTDADITSKAPMDRRSMLATVTRALGVTALVVGAAVAGSTAAKAASDKANTYDNDSHDRRPSTDND